MIALIDDATSEVLCARFEPCESTTPYPRALGVEQIVSLSRVVLESCNKKKR